ncbi:uncharacterized membrane protein YjfL (UPF0719 family) [Allocatelliglobosispora scoriae]|uniref:Uncharacterized membrane protein YjfL (UPF0719 family) n=1 Tax=Allocatelliglobosispora scoriae TaxID=643052 RepID=A0A841C0I5_9ACTN|nr:DUF350 domain-containing protein [Allocatelliglobosispora scoriae]MBB5872859.1 uncharacterized membrane protein YjfL (UPF0719 family) [Allocatelliglobosispora scoriae]
MTDLLPGLLAAVIYSVVGIVLLFAGFLMVDLITPGRLRDQIWVDRSRNAASYVATALLGIGAIVVTAIAVSDSDLLDGLVSTAVFGLAGTALMAGAFWVLDMLTPGRLGEMIVDPKPHPAVWVSCASNIAIAAIVCASMIP